MKNLIEYIVRHIVDHPEHVIVKEVGGDHTSVLELRVGKEDVGQVIGRQGRTARALRTVLTAVAAKQKKQSVLEIID